MRRIARFFAGFAIVLSLVGSTAPAYAFDFFNSSNPESVCKKANTSQSSACTANGSDPITGTNGIILKAVRIVSILAGIAAVIIIVISGFSIVTAAGDAAKVSSARSAITGSLIGLVIIIFAQFLVQFIVTKVL